MAEVMQFSRCADDAEHKAALARVRRIIAGMPPAMIAELLDMLRRCVGTRDESETALDVVWRIRRMGVAMADPELVVAEFIRMVRDGQTK